MNTYTVIFSPVEIMLEADSAEHAQHMAENMLADVASSWYTVSVEE